MLRLTIADDHPVVRAGLRSLIAARTDWSIVAEAQDGVQAVTHAIAHRPDAALIDYSLPLANGLEVTRQIKWRAPTVQILVLMGQTSEKLTREILSAGARVCVPKAQTASYLYPALEAASGRNEASNATSNTSANCRIVPSILTKQERRVTSLISDGHTNKSIARLLGISSKTVETHRSNIMQKLDLTSTAALVRYAIRNGLIEP